MPKFFFLYFLLFTGIISAQNKNDYLWPLEQAPVLTANYGQIRSNHFHAGIDLSTYGKENLSVRAIESGYVSRIKVSAYGYGKALYITHANGKVSVYGHLNAYSLKIDSFIKKEQYKIESYEIDCYPKIKLNVKKGEIIALSGNTGGSTGPHLHFEIRDELSEVPLNPLNYYKINDHIKPVLQGLAIFDLSDTLNPKFLKPIKVTQTKLGPITPQASITIHQSIIGFAFAGYDKNDGNTHLNNIYSTKLYVDNQEVYTHLLQAVSFDESRYVNEYAETSNGLVYQKCFLPVLAPADFVMNSSKQTRLVLKDTNYHAVKLVVADESANQTEVHFYVKTNELNRYYSNISNYEMLIDCRKDFLYAKDNLSLQAPPYTFFMSSPLTVKNSIEANGKLVLLPFDVNLKSALQIRFKIPEKYLPYKEKMILRHAAGIYTPTFNADSVSFFVKNLGSFQIDFDLVPPTVQFAPQSKKNKTAVSNHLAFIIKDVTSGISKYKLYINQKFYLAEFDAKSSLLNYNFDQNVPRGNLDIMLEVFDKAGNKTVKTLQVKH